MRVIILHGTTTVWLFKQGTTSYILPKYIYICMGRASPPHQTRKGGAMIGAGWQMSMRTPLDTYPGDGPETIPETTPELTLVKVSISL